MRLESLTPPHPSVAYRASRIFSSSLFCSWESPDWACAPLPEEEEPLAEELEPPLLPLPLLLGCPFEPPPPPPAPTAAELVPPLPVEPDAGLPELLLASPFPAAWAQEVAPPVGPAGTGTKD